MQFLHGTFLKKGIHMLVQVDIEKELNSCVKEIGGILIDEYHGPNEPEKADYWFPDFNVVGELKCLTEDEVFDDQFKQWLNKKYGEWIQRKLVKPFVGRAVFNLADLPPICANEVTSFLRKKLDSNFNKANSQIKSSKEELNVPSALGLVILVNDGKTALPAGMIQNILARSLPHKFSSINSVIHFTANMPSRLPHIENDVLVWCDWNVKAIRPPVTQDLIDRIRSTWISRFSQIVGETVPTFSGSADELYDLKFVPK